MTEQMCESGGEDKAWAVMGWKIIDSKNEIYLIKISKK
jgi:hypothetical protein